MECILSEPIVVAEISNVHLGNLDRAKKLAKLAKECGAGYLKTQKRNPEECVPIEWLQRPHPNPYFAYGPTYLEHRKKIELTAEQHSELKKYCDEIGIQYASSVWDLTSAAEIIRLNPAFIKVPSACNCNFDLIQFIVDNSGLDIHISTGMIDKPEKSKLFDYIRGQKDTGRFVVYHCTSEYPCEFERLFLGELETMQNELSETNVRYGFSNHGKGIAVDILAYGLGAEWIERHFIDDRAIPHSDAGASLEPPGLTKLCRDLKAAHLSYQYKSDITDLEREQRDKLRKV